MAQQETRRFRIYETNGRRSAMARTKASQKQLSPLRKASRDHVRRLIESGRCVNCCLPNDRKGRMCTKCNDKANQRHRERRAENRSGPGSTEVETRLIHFCPWENQLIWNDEKLGERVAGTRVHYPHRLLFKAILAESMHRIEELLAFGKNWETNKLSDPCKHEMNRSRCRVHYDWIMDDETHPSSFTFKELVEFRESSNSVDKARDLIFEQMPDAAMKELFRPFPVGEIRLARMNYIANKARSTIGVLTQCNGVVGSAI